jgi:hypothetical protein
MGFGYFEDGSMFIATHDVADHHLMEARMKTAAHFVSRPSPRLQAMPQEQPQEELYKNRLLILK